ncbi:hypothetical protein GBA52_010107 [Prunus armeniaca]|nr:hypothetical protein GBA52_010107 [Prunus armeniaca]
MIKTPDYLLVLMEGPDCNLVCLEMPFSEPHKLLQQEISYRNQHGMLQAVFTMLWCGWAMIILDHSLTILSFIILLFLNLLSLRLSVLLIFG